MSSNNNNNNNSKNSDNNWLGFSLSPHLPETTPSNPTTFFNYQHIYYGGIDGGIYSPFPIMPLKSDGSLCLIDSITKSQGIVTSTTPKLENFFGGVTIGTPDLDSSIMYYNQTYNNIPPQQHYQDYSNMDSTVQQDEPKISSDSTSNLYLPTIGEGWISNNYHSSDHDGDVGLQSLNLSMSPACSQSSSCVTISQQQLQMTPVIETLVMDTKKRGCDKIVQQKKIVHRKSLDTFGQRTSQYRGVTRHRWTGRYEAHLWDNSCKKEGQTRKGRQVYLGGYDMEEKAARAYDQAALKYWGPSTHINFPVENYEQELEEMRNMSRQEYVAHLRRRSSGFSRGASIYRGVTRHHQHGRWQARIGRVAGNKDLYLGTFSTQEDAAEAYDVAAIKFRGTNAVTNFDVARYNVEKIIESNSLLAGELARRIKDVDPGSQVDQLQNGDLKTISNEAEPAGDGLEDSPKRNSNLPTVLGMQQPLSNAWISTATETTTIQLRSHMPIFASWTDA